MTELTSSIWKPSNKAISIFLYINAVGVFIAGVSSILNGRFSFARVLILIISLFLSCGFCIIAWQTKNKIWEKSWLKFSSRKNSDVLLIIFFSLLFIINWSLVWTPLESFGGLYYYIALAFPYFIWLTIASGWALGLLSASRCGVDIHQFIKGLTKQKSTFKIWGGFLLVFTILAWIASFRILGVKPAEEDFWYGAGVPVLAFQVFWAMIAGTSISFIIDKSIIRFPQLTTQIKLALFLLIWAISAFFWAKEPVKPDFLVTQPVAPNFEMYPDYDARNYDLMSQFAMIGQGINNHNFFDRALYPAFLVYLHALAGQNYSYLMAIQSALFAILPALLFLIGSSIYNRTSGIVLGILAAQRGINQINLGSIIETAHQKQMLTEYPTAVLLVLTTLLLIQWIRNPQKYWWMAGIAGGIVGISTLLRPHTLVLIPVFFVLAFLVYRHQTRIWIGISTLFFASAILSVIPWSQFSGQNISIFDLYFTRIRDVIKQRYDQNIVPGGNNGSRPTVEISTGEPHQAVYAQKPQAPKGIIVFATDNFLNNLVTSFQILPTTPYNLEPRTVVKKIENFWKPYWDGKLSDWAKILIPLNIIIIALGLGTAVKRAQLSGLIPLIIMISYMLINAFGRTSGGRYIVPIDWTILIYYVFGLITLFDISKTLYLRPLAPSETILESKTGKSNWQSGTLMVLLFSLSIGSLIPLSQQIYPIKYQSQTTITKASIVSTIFEKQPGVYSKTNLINFMSSSDAVILTGRSLYPRQFNINEGLDISVYNYYHTMPFPRTLFTLIGDQGEAVIILPRTTPAQISNAADVLVIGCKSNGYVIAKAVIRLDDKYIYESINKDAPLACPLEIPTCDNNKICH